MASRRYTILIGGNVAGSQVVTARGDEVIVDFEYDDRGRGSKTHTVMRLRDGLPVSIVTTGVDYMKTPIEERFAVENGVARWTNTAESGEAKEGVLYASMYGPAEDMGVIAAALLKNGGTMPLAGGGEASIQTAGEMTLRGTRVAAYAVSGFAFQPFEVWLDDDRNFFASVSTSLSTIREGFEGDVQQLVDAQEARRKERWQGFTRRLTHRPANGRLVVTNARVFDPRTGGIAERMTIAVQGNRIASVTPGTAAAPQGESIDADGKTVLPGLWDMHVHITERHAPFHIAAGVTSARDLGNDSDTLLELKRKIESGETIGPRLVLAGLVDGSGPYKGPTKIVADNEEEAKNAVDYFAGRGYEGLKIYGSIQPRLVPLLARLAHEKGLRVSGHVPAGMTASQAIDAGFDEIQHANFILLNFMPDIANTSTPVRFTAVADRAADLDFESAVVRGFIQKLKDRGIVVDPTVTLFEGLFVARTGEMPPGYTAIAERLPPQMRRAILTGGLPVPEGKDQQYRASFRRMLDLVGALHEAGVTIVAGTDGFAGFTLHRELELYVEAGIPPAEVLRIATLVPAQILKREKDLGTIEPGKLADFILVDGDPAQNISDIRRVATVVKDGRVYDAKKIYGELGVK